jgi:hypothetical protein
MFYLTGPRLLPYIQTLYRDLIPPLPLCYGRTRYHKEGL